MEEVWDYFAGPSNTAICCAHCGCPLLLLGQVPPSGTSRRCPYCLWRNEITVRTDQSGGG